MVEEGDGRDERRTADEIRSASCVYEAGKTNLKPNEAEKVHYVLPPSVRPDLLIR